MKHLITEKHTKRIMDVPPLPGTPKRKKKRDGGEKIDPPSITSHIQRRV